MTSTSFKHSRRALRLGTAVCVLSLAPASLAEESLAVRQSADVNDLLAVERQRPAAVAALKEAEALLESGKPKEAAEKLEKARAEAPSSTVIARRYCQALMQLGQRRSAINACEVAMDRGRSPMTARATVGALMMGPPTPDDLAQALKLTERAKVDLTTQPYGYAAECDIARRLGDRAMYKTCLEELQSMAPGHYETERATALGGFAATPRWLPLAWIALALGSLGTALHAVWGAVRAKRLGTAASAVCMALALGYTSTGAAQEAPGPMDEAPVERSLEKPGGLSKWKIDDADPVKSLPSAEQRDKDPLNYGYFLMDLADKAQAASQQGKHSQASKYWEATVLAVPDVSLGYRRTCDEAHKAKELVRAFNYCRAALGRGGVKLADYEHYFALLQESPQQLQPEQLQDLLEIGKHVRTQDGGEKLADAIDCEYGVRASDMVKLAACSKKLAASAPNDPKTITYQWALALGQERFQDARGLIERARKTAMKPEGIKAMEAATAQRSSIMARLAKRPTAVVGVGIGVVVLLGSLLLSRWLSRRHAKPATVGNTATA